MLKLDSTRIGASFHRDVATGVTIDQEGTLLVYDREGDKSVVKPATGGVGEVVAGVALSRNNSLTRMTDVYVDTVPASGDLEITLPNEPLAGQLRVVGSATGEIDAGNPATTTGQYSISGSTLTFHADQAEEEMTVTYAFTPSVIQARQLTGDAPVGGLPSTSLGVIGVIDRGDVTTDQFDVTADWSSGLPVYTAANGLFTSTAGTTQVFGAVVLRAPSAGNPFVTISLR